MEHRTKEETVAIFDNLLSQMEGATKTLGQQSHSNDSLEPGNDENQNETEEPGTRAHAMAITKRRVQSSDVPSRDMIRRPSSSASLKKGEEPDSHPPRAASVEADMVFATLPKKKKKGRKWSGIKRIGSPLFRYRRKSFANATPTTNRVPSTVHVSVTQPSPSVPITTPISAPEKDKEVTPQPVAGEDQPRTAVQSVKTVVAQFVEEGAGPGRHGLVGARVKRRRSSAAPRDECLNALKVMTTLSSNRECLNSLISYICLPKCVTK